VIPFDPLPYGKEAKNIVQCVGTGFAENLKMAAFSTRHAAV